MNSIKTNEPYFSEEDEQDQEQEEPLESDEELDEDTMKFIYQSSLKKSAFEDLDSDSDSKKKKKKNSKRKEKKKLSLSEFYNKIENDKPKNGKKFMSSRVAERKKELDIVTNREVVIKRCFNPRLPPFNFIKNSNKEIDAIDEISFPKLG